MIFLQSPLYYYGPDGQIRELDPEGVPVSVPSQLGSDGMSVSSSHPPTSDEECPTGMGQPAAPPQAPHRQISRFHVSLVKDDPLCATGESSVASFSRLN